MDHNKMLLKSRNAWRGNMGYMCPALLSSDSIVEFHRMVPEGVGMTIATLGITQLTPHMVDQALAKVDDYAKRLADVGVDFISIEGTPLVSIRGFGWDKELISRVEKIASVPATTSMTAAVDAFHTLGVSKVVMASPLTHEFDDLAKKFVEANGIRVLHVESLNLKKSAEWRALPSSAAYIVSREAYLAAPEAEAIYIICGAWGDPQTIDALEKDFGKPVIHSRQAATWAFLKALNIREPVKGWGRIFETIYKA